jgi:hypothetical protein
MNCHRRNRPAFATAMTILLAAFTVACSDPVEPNPISPSASTLAKGGNAGGSVGAGANVLQGDFALVESDAAALASTCASAGFAGSGWAVVFGHSECLIVTPLWASTTYEPYPLRDDVTLNVQLEKGKNGRITHIRLYAQDVIGEAGIAHQTDWVAVATPVVPSRAGFTLHVHAKNVQVWRLDSHLAGGNRVEMIGTISIGDIVYPAR